MITMKQIYAFALLGLRAAVLHPLGQWFGSGDDGKDRFLRNYTPDGLVPLSAAERERLVAFQRCINCGLCDMVCPSGAQPSLLALAYSRATPDLPRTRAALALIETCPSCQGESHPCEQVCPRQVPIREIVAFSQRKLVEVDAARTSVR